jgi:cation diffusion facilitator CzcD-associated flavoprotein CzcO
VTAVAGLPDHTEILVVGAGFAGLAAAARLLQSGYTDITVIERGPTVGGTWRDNHYPGAACDVPSQLYSLSFAPNPEWSHSFSRQPQIQAYLEEIADRFGIRPHVHTHTALVDARWDDASALWRVRTSRGELTARWVLSAAGALSDPALPDVPGIEDFQGEVWHSAQWRHDVPLEGKRVAVIGTGASAIQFVPRVAKRADSVVLVQRTPAWILPRMDRRLRAWERRLYRRFPAVQRLVRWGIYWGRELYVIGFAVKPSVMSVPRRLALRHLERQVPDPELRARLTPSYEIGCKRILISNDFYPAVASPKVELVTAGLTAVGPRSITTADGREHDVDVLVFGTGFRVTDLPIAGQIRGRDGRTLAAVWGEGMHAHRGTTVPGFPNLFLVVGPNTGLGHSSQVFMIETQVEYVVQALAAAHRHRADVLEVRGPAERAWNADVQGKIARTVWSTGGCASWYLDSHGRNSVLWPSATWRFRLALRRFDAGAYRFERRLDRELAPDGVGPETVTALPV